MESLLRKGCLDDRFRHWARPRGVVEVDGGDAAHKLAILAALRKPGNGLARRALFAIQVDALDPGTELCGDNAVDCFHGTRPRPVVPEMLPAVRLRQGFGDATS